MTSCGIIILAAGASTRLGQPKQLLVWQNKTLLQHAVQTAMEVVNRPVLVLGAYAEQLLAGAHAWQTQVQLVRNTGWTEGMASSIRCGLEALLKEAPQTERVIFMVCDQPFVSANLLKSLIGEHEQTGKAIIASAYAGALGIPALFDKTMFSELLHLQGNTGAKKLIQRHAGQVATVDFPAGNIDIDTNMDYDKLMKDPINPGDPNHRGSDNLD